MPQLDVYRWSDRRIVVTGARRCQERTIARVVVQIADLLLLGTPRLGPMVGRHLRLVPVFPLFPVLKGGESTDGRGATPSAPESRSRRAYSPVTGGWRTTARIVS